jgi:hypothetical protein
VLRLRISTTIALTAITVGLTLCATATAVQSTVSQCRSPRLIGATVAEAIQKADRAGCVLQAREAHGGAPVTLNRSREVLERVIARQAPAPGHPTHTITVWLRPPCYQSADPGPPSGEPLVKPGPTSLISGLFLDGGPLARRGTCAKGTPSPGTIEVLDTNTDVVVASQTVEAGKLADIRLAAGTYLVRGTFGDAFSNEKPIQTIPISVTIKSNIVVRQDVLANIP